MSDVSCGPVDGQLKVLCDPDDNSYLAHLQTIAQKDADGLLRAHGHYGNSWKKRGGVSAFMMLARKWDRLEKFCEEHGYNIFEAMAKDVRGEGIIDDIRDLRRYLLLVEAEAMTRGMECTSAQHRDNLEETGKAYHPPGIETNPEITEFIKRQNAQAAVYEDTFGGDGTCLNGPRRTNVDGESVVRDGPKDDRSGFVPEPQARTGHLSQCDDQDGRYRGRIYGLDDFAGEAGKEIV